MLVSSPVSACGTVFVVSVFSTNMAACYRLHQHLESVCFGRRAKGLMNVMNENWFFPGSKWWKFDFHTHTPESLDYGRGDEAARNVDAESWLRTAMERKLDCVAVTDHNSGGWIDKLKRKYEELSRMTPAQEWFRPLIIFPGVEINVMDSKGRIHLIALFDSECNGDTVKAVMWSCGIRSDFGDDKKPSTDKGFLDTVKKINEAKGIAIPAHIDSSKGLLEGVASLTPELRKSLDALDAAEFRNFHAFEDSNIELKKAVDRLAKLSGSDAHKLEEIGRSFSWLKMSRPTIDEVRLALLDHEFCVKNQDEDPNHVPDIFLSNLAIREMSHCGRVQERPFSLTLHPHFNAIIGGRGTGKSTVIESIRIASRRDQGLDVEAPSVKDELDKFMKLSRDNGVMLENTELLLQINRRGKDFRLRWRYDGRGDVLEELVDDGWRPVEAGDIRERFPVSIYSQKQINELALNPRGLLEVLDRSPEVNRKEWASRWEGIKSRFLQLSERRRELSNRLLKETEIRTELNDVANDLRQYEEKGHGEILKKYQKRSRQKNSLPTDEVFEGLSTSIRELAETAELADFPAHLFDESDNSLPEMLSIHQRYSQALKEIGVSLEDLAGRVDALKKERRNRILSSSWFQSLKSSIEAYEVLVKEYDNKNGQLNLSLYGEWVSKRNNLQKEINQLESMRKERADVARQIEELRKKMLGLRDELHSRRTNFIKKVIGSNRFVRMELVQFGDVNSIEEEYRSIMNLENGRFASSVYDAEEKQGLLYGLINWEENNTPEADLQSKISGIKTKTRDIAEGKHAGNHGAFDNRLKKLLEIEPAVFDRLDVWWPEDLLRVKYSKDPGSGKFDNLEKGSAGQKAAAILAFLLSHGNEPLIIDQPEDDLDNALIYDLIVSQIHENKERRQLIIVTHNPNIVVNGDSELVHVLTFEKGQVQVFGEGGPGEAAIRESVCNIMEGGRQAFEKRYKRITMEL